MSKKSRKRRNNNRVTKALADTPARTASPIYRGKGYKRGITLLNTTQLQSLTGQTESGKQLQVTYEQPLFFSTIQDRETMYRLCSPVTGVVNGIINKVKSLDWSIVPREKDEETIVSELRAKYGMYRDFKTQDDLKYKVAAAQIHKVLKDKLPGLLPDGSNFQSELHRLRSRIKTSAKSAIRKIEEFVEQPNKEDSFTEFVEKWCHARLVHGASPVFKKKSPDGSRIESIWMLPGGTVMPVKSGYADGIHAYIQVVSGMDPLIYFSDELSYIRYMSNSQNSYGMVPLEALLNKIAETLMYDKLMADQADGTKAPEKLVVLSSKMPFADDGEEFELEVPLDQAEQERIEQIANQARKDAVRTLTGYSSASVLDISKSDNLDLQNQRQKQIREEVALVFGVSNLEVNMSAGDGVSGRATSESLETIDQNKALIPIVKDIQYLFNKEVLPYAFPGIGDKYELKYQVGKNRDVEVDRAIKLKSSGLFSTNRALQEIGEDPYYDEKYDMPEEAQQPAEGGGLFG